MHRLAGPARDSGPKRVGINAVFLQPGMGGLETYVMSLVPEILRLAPHIRVTVFCNTHGLALFRGQPWSGEVTFVTHPLFGVTGMKAVAELTLLGVAASRRVDLLHNPAFTAPVRSRCTNVLVIPDLIWKMAPDPADMVTTAVRRLLVPPVARRADRVVAISHAAADDIARLLPVPRSSIDVTPLGPGAPPSRAPMPEREVRSLLGIPPGPVILTLAAKRVHKNLARLVEAMPLVVGRHPCATLVLPGKPTPHEADLKRLASGLGLEANVVFPSYLESAVLEGLYATSECFALPSLIEGFGLPILEAMQRGVPVACSRVSALPEVAGDAAEFFDPTRVEDIGRALIRLLDDPQRRTELSAAGRRRAAEFTWEATAVATLESWERAQRAMASC